MSLTKLLSITLPVICFVGCFQKNYDYFLREEIVGDKTVIHGFARLENDSYVSLRVNGAASFEKVKVKEHLDVNGAFKAEDCSLGEVVVHGSIDLEDSKVSDLLQVYGYAEFHECKLEDVEITSSSAEFEDSKVSDILMKKNPQFFGNSQQKVILEDTKVLGNVTFEQGEGLVVLKGSSVIKGKIIGGKINRGDL